MLMALALAALSIILAAGQFNYTIGTPPPAYAPLRSKPSSYLGVFPSGSPSGYQPVAAFAAAIDQRPNLAGYFSGWAEPFDTRFADTLRSHHIIPLVQINPTDASMAGIADGDYDGSYLRPYADSVRDFGSAVVIGFGPEMNANWTPWGYGHVAPSLFVKAWQHVVTVFSEQGARNVTWLWTVQADQPGTGPIRDWWPGSSYVNWVGIDGFYYRPADTFNTVFGPTIDQVRTFTTKAVLLAETAVGPQAGQFSKILNLFSGMAAYKTLGLVWFDIDQTRDAGIYHQDWQILSNSPAATSFRAGVHDELPNLAPG
jgi:Glycosyl hydrolase family 26